MSPSGIISGNPGVAGIFNFTVRVTDSTAASATTSLILTVSSGAAPLGIVTASLPAATAGTAYAQQLSASGGTPPYSWSLAAGSLPAGFVLDTSGVILGTSSTTGTFNFTARVTDDVSTTATASLSIIVNPANGLLSIVTTSLPAVNPGSFYYQALTAAGGTPPYAWTFDSGALPDGLFLSTAGFISGTPIAPPARLPSMSG